MRTRPHVALTLIVLAVLVLAGPVAAALGPCSSMGADCEGPCGNGPGVLSAPASGSPQAVASLPDAAAPVLRGAIPSALDPPPRIFPLAA